MSQEKGWYIFHNDSAQAQEWTKIENSAKILDSEHIVRLKAMDFKPIEHATRREKVDLNRLSEEYGFDPNHLPPENLNTISEFGGMGKTEFYNYVPEIEVEFTEANVAKIKEHERHIGEEIAKDRQKVWCGGF
jgi:hypothetical protein